MKTEATSLFTNKKSTCVYRAFQTLSRLQNSWWNRTKKVRLDCCRLTLVGAKQAEKAQRHNRELSKPPPGCHPSSAISMQRCRDSFTYPGLCNQTPGLWLMLLICLQARTVHYNLARLIQRAVYCTLFCPRPLKWVESIPPRELWDVEEANMQQSVKNSHENKPHESRLYLMCFFISGQENVLFHFCGSPF